MVSCGVFLIFVADSLGRRRSLLWTSIAQGLAMLYIGLYIRIAPPVEGAPVIPAGYVALVCIFLFAAFFQFGWGPVCWIYVSEIPTARLRSLNVAFGAATQWLFNFVVARAVPNMLATVGANGYGWVPFLLIGCMILALTMEHAALILSFPASVCLCLSSCGSLFRRQKVSRNTCTFPSRMSLLLTQFFQACRLRRWTIFSVLPSCFSKKRILSTIRLQLKWTRLRNLMWNEWHERWLCWKKSTHT